MLCAQCRGRRLRVFASVLTSAQRFIDDLQQLIDSIEQNDTERGLASLRRATEKKRDNE